MGAKRTAWHFYFCLLLRRYAPKIFEIRDEVRLSEEPPRMDYLILRRSGELSVADPGETLVELWPRLSSVTIAELKTVPGPYEKGNLDRLWMYCHGYFAGNHKALVDRDALGGLLIVPSRTPTLDEDARAMGLTWQDLGHGYWRALGGKFSLLVVEIDVVAGQPDEDLLGLYAHSAVRTPRAIKFWGELAGSEAKMEARELEGYEEAIQKILSALPPELRLAGLPPEQRLAGLPPEQRLAGLAPEQRLAGLPPEQRLAGLPPEQAVLAMPVELLRALSKEYLATLPEATRAEIERRLGRS
jgi:hypothetical protein